MARRFTWLLVLALAACGCSSDTPAPATPGASPAGTTPADDDAGGGASSPGYGSTDSASGTSVAGNDAADPPIVTPNRSGDGGPAAGQAGGTAAGAGSAAATGLPAAPTVNDKLRDTQTLAAAGDLDGAAAKVKEALEIDPRHRNALLIAGNLYQTYAIHTIVERGEPDKGYPKFLESAEFFRRLIEAHPNLTPQEQSLFANALYNESCAYSVAKQTDKAMQSLKESVAAGMDDPILLFSDPDMDNLRELEGFDEIKYGDKYTFPFDFTLSGLDDRKVSLADFAGKVVIVNLWGTWSPQSQQLVPHLIALKQKYEPQGLEVVGITYQGTDDDAHARQAIQSFVADKGINYPCLIGDEKTQDQVVDFAGYPTTIFIDRTGVVRCKVHIGQGQDLATEAPKFESIVRDLLEKDPAPPGADTPSNQGEA